MGIDDAQIFQGEIGDFRQQDTDVAPVAFFRFARFAGIRSISLNSERLPGIAGRPRVVGAFQDRLSDSFDPDPGYRDDRVDANPAIRAPDEIVPAEIRQFDFAVYDIQKMLPIFSKQNSRYTSLEKAYIELVPEDVRSGLFDHRAEHDAMKTMLVYRAMLKDLGFTTDDLLDSCPNSRIIAFDYWKEFKETK